MSNAVITVSNATELMAALAGATGGEIILLQAGNYGGLSLDDARETFLNNYASVVTITSANADDLAVFTSLSLTGVENLSFDSIKFDYTATAWAPEWTKPFAIVNSTGISIANSVFDGDLNFTLSTSGTGTGIGLNVLNSQNITINNNEFFDWKWAAVFDTTTNLNVTNNDVHDVRSDGFDLVNVDNVLIEQNYIHDFVGAPNNTVITVSNATELMSALANATGGETILLQAGNYGDLTLWNVRNTFLNNYTSEVTIKSANPNDLASFTSMTLCGVKNLSFDSIKFDYTAAAGAWESTRPFNVDSCTGITIANSVFDGDLDYSYSATGTGTGIGLSVNSSQNVTLNQNEFFNWLRAAVFSDDTNLNVTANNVHDIRSDGFDFANVDNVLIEKNYIHDFVNAAATGDHADMIQFWTSGTTSPSTNIVIRGNILDSGDGGWTQSIFMRNEMVDSGGAGDAMFYQNILIEDNVIYNAFIHGITVGETHGLIIQNNTILQNPDSVDGGGVINLPTIHVAAASTEVVVINNILPQVMDVPVAGALIANNVIVQSDNPDGANYVGDLFVDALAGANATIADLQAIPGGIPMGVGSSLTHFSTQPAAPVGFIVDDAGAGLSLLTHSLDASNLYGPSGQIDLQGAAVVWSFGDGTTASGVTVNHAFAHAGSYDVTATVTLASGALVQVDKTIAVQTPVALRADFNNGAQDLSDITNLVTVAPSVTFEAGASGQAIRLNGGTVTYQSGPEFLNNPEYTLLFDFKKDPGQESAAGQVINFGGSVVVFISSDGITAAIVTDQQTKWLNVSNIGINDADWHKVALTFSAAAGTAILYVDGAAVGQVDGLSGIQAGSPYQDFSIGDPWGGGFPGLVDNVAFLKGSMSAQQISAYTASPADFDLLLPPPMNDAPVASPVTLASIAEDGASRLITQANLLVGVSDVDGPNLSITALSIQSGKGMLINDSNGTWSYTPAINDDGSVTFNYSASDGTQTASSTATLDITPLNDAPVATDDVAKTQKNAAVNINVLSNDVDVDGNGLSIFGTPDALHGTVTLNSDGSLHYTPVSGYVGSDTISYAVTDGSLVDTGVVAVTVDDIINDTTSNDVIDDVTHAPSAPVGEHVGDGYGGTDSAIVDIVLNRPPTPIDDSAVLQFGKQLVVDADTNGVLSNDVDADGDVLSIASISGGDLGSPVSGQYGSLTLQVDGGYTYTSNVPLGAAGIGFDVFTYQVDDGYGGRVSSSLTLTIFSGQQNYVSGTPGDDVLFASPNGSGQAPLGNGKSILSGGAGNDTILGGNGPDVLIGGSGDNLLTGGRGPDTFVFDAGSVGQNIITDFKLGVDHLEFIGTTVVETFELNGSTILELSNGGGVTLTGIAHIESWDVLV